MTSTPKWPETPAERQARKQRVQEMRRDERDEFELDRDGYADDYTYPRPGTYAWGAS